MTRLTGRMIAAFLVTLMVFMGVANLAEAQVLEAKPIAPPPVFRTVQEAAQSTQKPEAPEAKASPSPEEAQELVRLRAEEIRLKKENERLLRELSKQDDPEMKEARRELQREAEERAKRAERNRKAVAEAALEGCDPATVEVKPYGQDFQPFAMFPVTLVVRVVNTGNAPITIETAFRGLGTVVRNLCGGGSINISFKLRWEDSQMVNIPIIARATLPNGRHAQQSRQFFLSKYQSRSRRVEYENWVINLDNR